LCSAGRWAPLSRRTRGSFAATLAVFRVVAVLGVAGVAAGVPAIARRCGVPTGRALWIALAGPLVGAYALAATVAPAPYFHPWYATWLVLLAAATVRNRLMTTVAIAGPLLVLPDGSGLARFVKFPGARCC
jgi:hypothetical protein